MPHIILGAPGAVEQPKRYRGDTQNPDTIVRSWKGPKEAILNLIRQAKVGRYTWRVEEGPGPLATIEMEVPISAGGGGGEEEVPVDTWELLPGIVEKDLLDSDNVAVANLTIAQRDQLRDIIHNGKPESPSWAFSGSTITDAGQIYALMSNGVRSAIQFAPVMRRTRAVSNAYATKQANTNVRRILSTETLVDDEAVPGSFLITLDSSPYTDQISGAEATLRASRGQPPIQFGWLKHSPTLQQAAFSRLHITQEWHFGLWSTVLYDEVL